MAGSGVDHFVEYLSMRSETPDGNGPFKGRAWLDELVKRLEVVRAEELSHATNLQHYYGGWYEIVGINDNDGKPSFEPWSELGFVGCHIDTSGGQSTHSFFNAYLQIYISDVLYVIGFFDTTMIVNVYRSFLDNSPLSLPDFGSSNFSSKCVIIWINEKAEGKNLVGTIISRDRDDAHIDLIAKTLDLHIKAELLQPDPA